MSERLTMTVEEAATALGISRGTAYGLVREGRLPAVRLGAKRLVIPRASLDAFLTAASRLTA